MKNRSQALRMSLTFCLLLAPVAGWGQGSEWKWLTGGNLKAVKFIGQKGWIIGDDGNQGDLPPKYVPPSVLLFSCCFGYLGG